MAAKNAPILLKKLCFCALPAVSVALDCALLFMSGGGRTTGSSCMTLLFSNFKVKIGLVISGAGSLARKTNGASTAMCSSGEGVGRGLAVGCTALDSTGGGGGGAALATWIGGDTGHPQFCFERTASLRIPPLNSTASSGFTW